MTDVNINLDVSNSSLSSSLLPSELEYSMPEGEISRDYSNSYVSMYIDEYITLQTILKNPLYILLLIWTIPESGIITYLEKLLEIGIISSLKPLNYYQEIKKLEEDIYMNYLNDVGTFDSSLKLLVSALIELLPFRLRNSETRVSLANVLGKSTWNYVFSTLTTVLPLFATTLYNMAAPQDFQVSS